MGMLFECSSDSNTFPQSIGSHPMSLELNFLGFQIYNVREPRICAELSFCLGVFENFSLRSPTLLAYFILSNFRSTRWTGTWFWLICMEAESSSYRWCRLWSWDKTLINLNKHLCCFDWHSVYFASPPPNENFQFTQTHRNPLENRNSNLICTEKLSKASVDFLFCLIKFPHRAILQFDENCSSKHQWYKC